MADSKHLIQQVAQEIAASRTTSPTPRGQNKPTAGGGAFEPTGEHVEAINQVFALFRLNYHNQYYAAFPDAEQLSQIKRLWLESLADYPVEQILRGAKRAIENAEYLPTLHRMHECCQAGLTEIGLPSARDAYLEACRAASPKSAQRWSHPAVYLAGRDSDWFFLANNVEKITWSVFREHYQRYCSKVLRGEELDIPAPEALESPPGEHLTVEERMAQLKALRDSIEI